jgi:voltage-gated potassium channel
LVLQFARIFGLWPESQLAASGVYDLDVRQVPKILRCENANMRINKTRINRLVRQGLVYSLLLAVAILGLGGVGFWVIDPRIDNLGDGLWLAFTTAATVGYGDLIPHTPASRIFSVLVVLLGLAVLSLVTASLSAIFVEKEVEAEEREIERALLAELRVLREELHSLREEVRELRNTR